QAEDGIRVFHVTGVQTCALRIYGRLTGPGRAHRLDLRHVPPGPPGHLQAVDPRVRDGAGVDRLDAVGAVPAQSRRPVGVDREPDPGAPPQSVRGAGQLLPHALAVDAGDPVQLFGDHPRLDPPLGVQGGVLPVAAP